MRTTCLVLVLAVVLVLVSSPAQGREFGWTLSSSLTDPFENTGLPTPGVVYIYLWYTCTNTTEGLGSAEFDICSDIGTLPLTFTPFTPWVFIRDPGYVLIFAPDCPLGPVPVGWFLFVDPGSGIQAYMCPSAANGLNISVNCIELDVYPNDTIGYASDGSPAPTNCDYDLCGLIAVQSSNWGNVKSLYR